MVLKAAIGIDRNGNLAQAIEGLLALEKQTRTAGDASSTGRILVCIIDLCYKAKDYKSLNEHVLLLNKRRSQLKGAIKDMVKRCMHYLGSLPYDKEMELIDALISVTEGKIFVEKQRARLMLHLSKIREKEGNIATAASILQEVQVETFGSMKKKEKTEYILEQMRLSLLKKDYIHAQIISKKINLKNLNDPDFQQIKVRYHMLMIDYYNHEKHYLNIFRSYQAIYDTPMIQEDDAKWKLYLSLSVVYLVLAPYDNEQFDLLNRTALDKRLEFLPLYLNVIKSFLKPELLGWKQFYSQVASEFECLPAFRTSTNSESRKNKEIWEDLHNRVTEHNIRVIAKYYSLISMKRLAQLLDLEYDSCNKYVCDLVLKKSVFARIDRINGTVNFVRRQEASETLNDWAGDITSLLALVDKTCHLIYRENMMHANETNAKKNTEMSGVVESK
ncbi:26S proteasome non-ATPase regulatory subunit 12-like isoform X2 [Schistocerca gregaria]|uniref:26S proteasome non-ATPase regulatory subunit 12-like isoform X2 n=1 Tax=Schistocerca gregaria TaxID=7010 RepID=UPI00211F2693|nr:26S proteasome non-ATPase regulatory subunit 12-like isoform X2 [Schistocerca gregaria]